MLFVVDISKVPFMYVKRLITKIFVNTCRYNFSEFYVEKIKYKVALSFVESPLVKRIHCAHLIIFVV